MREIRVFFWGFPNPPNIVCHTEQSEVSILNAVFRSNAFGDVANARCEIKQVLFHSHNRNIHIR